MSVVSVRVKTRLGPELRHRAVDPAAARRAVEALRAQLELIRTRDDLKPGQEGHGMLARDLGRLGESLLALDCAAEAVAPLREAVACWVEADRPRPLWLTRLKLARALAETGDVDAASKLYAAFWSASEASPEVLGVYAPFAWMDQAALCVAQGAREDARAALLRAREAHAERGAKRLVREVDQALEWVDHGA